MSIDAAHLVPSVLHTTIGVLLIVLRGGLVDATQAASNFLNDSVGAVRGDERIQRTTTRLVVTALATMAVVSGVLRLLDGFSLAAR